MESSTGETETSALLKDVIAYVEVRSNSDNRSAAVCRELQQLGAQVESSFTDDVTHVVFKEGMRRTYNKAQKKGIPLVSVTWLESCKTNRKLMPEKEYAALIPEETESPLFRLNPQRRWRKMKSMQPYDYEEEVARSAERSVKRRRRVEEANRFKLLEESTPTSSSSSVVLVPETQGRSPYLSELSRSNSPSLAVVADTPITPTMKERIERMRQEQQNILGPDEQSPRGTGRQKPAMLQKRLFEKLAKDIFSTEDSDGEDEDTTARVVAKLIDGLESQEEDVGSPRKRLTRGLSNDDMQRQFGSNNAKTKSDNSNIHLIRKSPRQKSSKTVDQNNLKNQHCTALSNPLQSPRNTNPNHKATIDIEEKIQERIDAVEKKSSISPPKEDFGFDPKDKKFMVLNNRQSDGQESSVITSSKRKKILLSESEVCFALQCHQPNSIDTKDSTEIKLSKKKEKDKLSEEVSFLFGCKNKTNSNLSRRRSARLNVRMSMDSNDYKVTTDNKEQIKNSKLDVKLPVRNTLTEYGRDKNTCRASDIDQLSNSSMSLMYDQDSSVQSESSSKMLSRRSIDEFSMGSKRKVANSKKGATSYNKQSHKASKLSSIGAVESSEECRDEPYKTAKSLSARKIKSKEQISTERRKSIPMNHKYQTSSSSESEDMPCKLRHASSLVMESSANPSAKRSHVFLVMTSLHRDEQEIVLSVVKKLGVFKLTDNVDDNTTHVICGEPRRTLNLLRAITRGCWVLRKEWAFESLEAGKWLYEEDYEMVEDFPIVKDTRCNRMRNGKSYKTDLFSELGPIFVAKTCVPPRKDLVDLITTCRGSVTSSQQRAEVYIDSDFSENRTSIKPVWILGIATVDLPSPTYNSETWKERAGTDHKIVLFPSCLELAMNMYATRQ